MGPGSPGSPEVSAPAQWFTRPPLTSFHSPFSEAEGVEVHSTEPMRT